MHVKSNAEWEHSAILLTFTLEHSAILLTFIKLPELVIETIVLSIFDWPFYTPRFTVYSFTDSFSKYGI